MYPYLIIVCLCIWHDITIRRIHHLRSENLLNQIERNQIERDQNEQNLQEINPDDVESLDIENISPNKLVEQTCCICCESFTDEDDLSNIGECKFHLFHKDCTINYLKHNFKSCPICKK